MNADDKGKAKFFALMARYNELGRLLPDPDDLDTDDATAVAEARIVLKEMAAVQAELDAMMGLPT
jgi:hypothetical protein